MENTNSDVSYSYICYQVKCHVLRLMCMDALTYIVGLYITKYQSYMFREKLFECC